MGGPPQGGNLVFIVGCPRSGTTYLQKLLAAHPRIHTGQESDLFDLYVGPLLRTWRRELNSTDGRGGVGLACYFKEEEFVTAVREFVMRLLGPMVEGLGAGELFVEKTPSHALFMEEISLCLPRARFVHLLRDPRDVVASLLAASRSWGRDWAPPDARRAAELWRAHVEAVRGARIPDERIREVRYEQLWDRPGGILEELAEFLGIEWDRADLSRAVEENRFDAARRGKGTAIPKKGEFGDRDGPVVKEPEGFLRRGAPGGWHDDLGWWDRFWIKRVAGETMKKVGYA